MKEQLGLWSAVSAHLSCVPKGVIEQSGLLSLLSTHRKAAISYPTKVAPDPGLHVTQRERGWLSCPTAPVMALVGGGVYIGGVPACCGIQGDILDWGLCCVVCYNYNKYANWVERHCMQARGHAFQIRHSIH